MRILLTGASGFIGTYLARELSSSGHDVVGVDYVDGDLASPDVARHLISVNYPDLVVHLAAKVGRLFGEENPGTTIGANAIATTYVARVCGQENRRLVYVSTSEAFGDQGRHNVTERDPDALPHNLYGLSKRWGEEAARLYAPKGLQILRLSMPYGPGLPAGRGRAAVVTFLWQAHRRKPITVHRNGHRCLCWIGDLIAGIRMIIEDSGAGIWTVGRNDNETPMLEVAQIACKLAGCPFDLITEIDPPVKQTLIKRLNVNRLSALGWQPRIGLRTGMSKTYEAVKLYDEDGMPPSGWGKMIGGKPE